MILDVLIFTLGFLVAGLLALAALPAVWRRALRLSGERLSRLVPLSPDEIAAERDHLRAAHAVELRRSEQRLERAETARAALQIEAGRRESRILALDQEAARAQVRMAGFEAEVAALCREVDGLRAENGAEAIALYGLSTLAENRLFLIAALQSERGTLQAQRDALEAERDGLAVQVDQSRGTLAGLETRLMGAESDNGALTRELDQARRDVTAAVERLSAALPAVDAATAPEQFQALLATRNHEIESLTAELAFMTEQAASAERRATDTTKAYEALRAGRAAG